MKTAEDWVTINGFEHYLISNKGNCKSIDREIKYTDGRVQRHKSRMLKKRISNSGYAYFSFWCNSMEIKMYQHNPENHKEINHKDGDTLNNNIENLEWCTHSENCLHSYRVLKRKPSWLGRCGENHNRRKNYKHENI